MTTCDYLRKQVALLRIAARFASRHAKLSLRDTLLEFLKKDDLADLSIDAVCDLIECVLVDADISQFASQATQVDPRLGGLIEKSIS